MAHGYVGRSHRFNLQQAYEKALENARQVAEIAEASAKCRSRGSVNAGTALAHLQRWEEAGASYRSAVWDFDISDDFRKEMAVDIILESSHPQLVAANTEFVRETLKIGVDAFFVVSGSDAVELLQSLAKPEMKHRWSAVFGFLRDFLPPEQRQGLEILSPVAEILEGADPSSTNRLPPEQRDFIHEVLQRFEAEET